MVNFIICVRIMPTITVTKNEFIKMKRYWKEILWLLMIKAILLSGIWYVCFSNPPKLDDSTTANHLFN